MTSRPLALRSLAPRSLALVLGAAALVAPGRDAAAQDSAAVAAPPVPAVAPDHPDTVSLDRIAAVVGTHPVLLRDVFTEINYRRAQGMPMPTDSAGVEALMHQVTEELVNAELLVAEAKRLGVEVSEGDLKKEIDQIVARYRQQVGGDAQLIEELRKAGMGTMEQWRKSLTEQRRKNMLQEELVAQLKRDGKLPPVPVSDADLEREFAALPNKPRRPTEIGFRQIIIAPKPSEAARAAARAKADSLRAEIVAGADFEAVAKRASMDGSAQLGGDLGWIRRGKTVPEFERWLFGPYALPPGRLSPVVETPYGYHIIRVDRVQPAEVKARHILIMPHVDSADLARARVSADSVAAAWRAGASYDELLARYHDKAEQSLVPAYPLDQLPESYQHAFGAAAVDSVLPPFDIDDPRTDFPKIVIAQIRARNEGGEYTLDEFRSRFRQQLGETRAFERYLTDLRHKIFVDVRI
ncbi:MAG TPA: peptidylprolyl isomerase [Gemmatimonadaceae bacterium]|nr:peptidylprolyl isomerase [Gemmatimonadaceae bacterium]